MLEEDYLKDGMTSGELTVTLRDGEYFVMGDNRFLSTDSRFYGTFTQKDIIGKAIFRWYPFDQMGSIKDLLRP
jgi:signal peptidase I